MKRGFTLLEILLVIAAIGILAAIVIVAINPNRQLAQARDAERRSAVNTLSKALEQYVIDTGQYPSGIDATFQEICIEGGSLNCVSLETALIPTYLASIPVDSQATGDGSGFLVSMNSLNNRPYVGAIFSEIQNEIGLNQYIPTRGLEVLYDASVIESYPGTGGTWFDLSVNSRNATLQNGAIYDAGMNQSMFLDGIDDYVDFSTTPGAIQLSSPWTISMWVRVDTSENGAGRQGWFIWKGPGNQSPNQLLSLGISNSQIEVAHWSNDYTFPASSVAFDDWQHIVVTFDEFNSETLYVNGQFVNTRTSAELSVNGGQWYLGTRAAESQYLHGHIGQVALYSRALDLTEVQALYQNTSENYR